MATIKITVHEARNLPVMDRATGLADPYVFVQFDDMSDQTPIKQKTVNPQWNKDFRFDIPELQSLQEDPLEVRVYDHDVFSRDDIIGSVFIDWNCLLEDSNPRPTLSQWFPLYDTMSGLRGEVRLTLKVIFHGGINPFAPHLPLRNRAGLKALGTGRSEGVAIFSMARLDPSVYRVEALYAMVEELLVKADPEQSTLTSLRSSRSTYEARMVQLFKLSGKVRRLLSKKVIELGCNCVLGYRETFDFENVNGIIVRAYGTPCVISAVDQELALMGTKHHDPQGDEAHKGRGDGEDKHDGVGGAAGAVIAPGQHNRHVHIRSRALLDITKLTRSQVDVLTVTQLPPGVLTLVAGTVCARSVKVVSRHRAKASMLQERDAWWMELREEIKANARSYGCNAVLAYKEETLYFEDVVLLTAIGTAVSVDRSWKAMHLGPEGAQQLVTRKFKNNRMCRLLHMPPDAVGETEGPKCERCRRKIVPDIIVMSSELPNEMVVDDWPRLIEVRAVKAKPDSRGVDLAYTISQAIPFLEYTLHRQLLFKMKTWGLNCLASLRMQITISEYLIVATTTGTGFRVRGLPVPLSPKVEYPAVTEPTTVMGRGKKQQKTGDALVERFKSQIDLVRSAADAHKLEMESSANGGNTTTVPDKSPSHSPHHDGSHPPPLREGTAAGPEREGTGPIQHHGLTHALSSNTDMGLDVGEGTKGLEEGSGKSSSDGTSDATSSSSSDDDAYDRREFLLQIDDAEEAETMSGMFDGPTQADSVLFSTPYFHGDPNLVEFSQQVLLQRKYDIGKMVESGLSAIEFISSKCVGDAKRGMIFKLWQFSRRKRRRCVVLSFRSEVLFMQDQDNHLHVRLSGMFSCLREDADVTIPELENMARLETDRIIGPTALSSSSSDTDSDDDNELETLPPHLHFITATAPFSIPFVGRGHVEGGSDTDSTDSKSTVEGMMSGPTREGSTLFGREGSTLQPHSIFGLSTPVSSQTVPAFPTPTQSPSPPSSPYGVGNRGLNSIVIQTLTPGPVTTGSSHHGAVAQGGGGPVQDVPPVHLTPLDYVPGGVITKYIGRLSLHFIREVPVKTQAEEEERGLGTFFASTLLDVNHVATSLAVGMNGTAVLDLKVTFHEMEDTEKWGYLFISISGHVVEHQVPLLVPGLPSIQSGEEVG